MLLNGLDVVTVVRHEDVIDDIHSNRIGQLDVAGLNQSRGVREPGISHIRLIVFPVDKVLRPLLPLLLRSGAESRLRRKARLAEQRAGSWCEGVRESGSRVSIELNKGRMIRQSRVGDLDLVIEPVNMVLSPLLPFLFSLDLATQRWEARATGTAGKSETYNAFLALNELLMRLVSLGKFVVAQPVFSLACIPLGHVEVVTKFLFVLIASGKLFLCAAGMHPLRKVDIEHA